MKKKKDELTVNTGLDGFVLIDEITESGTKSINGIKRFSNSPFYLGIESLAQLGAYHVRFLTRFERHAFLLKITHCRMPAEQVLDGRYLLCGTLMNRSESAFSYILEAKQESGTPLLKGKIPPASPLVKVGIKGEFLYGTLDYNDNFKKEILQNHYRKVFLCLLNDLKTE